MYYDPYEERVHRDGSLVGRARGEARIAGHTRSHCTLRPRPQSTRYYRNSPSTSAPSSDVNIRYRNTPRKSARPSGTIYGVASWYGRKYHGRRTSNGEIYNMHAHTAAHRTLPFGTVIRVTNLRNGCRTVVRINDRGPFVAGREIDLSYQAARDLGMLDTGLERVRLEIL
ncbi:MAG: septal ring lytic transglycosylase RlpA family protein [Candidatus Hydrogenedentota bacterium]|nr:MAG: septal ring lytic transglycosylase RlpA family protein [Candidatus Hydrogenedentota bacterium]